MTCKDGVVTGRLHLGRAENAPQCNPKITDFVQGNSLAPFQIPQEAIDAIDRIAGEFRWLWQMRILDPAAPPTLPGGTREIHRRELDPGILRRPPEPAEGSVPLLRLRDVDHLGTTTTQAPEEEATEGEAEQPEGARLGHRRQGDRPGIVILDQVDPGARTT